VNHLTPWNGKTDAAGAVASGAQAKGWVPQETSNLQVRTPETLPPLAGTLGQSSEPSVTSLAETTQHAESPAATVTPPSGGTPAAERKRQQRERERLARQPPFFERTDWSLFINPRTLSQKAGCQPADIRRLVLRELIDNALDAGANATVERIPEGWCVTDDGPGLNPVDVPRLFSVNRTLQSSKQLRLPTRGMVGNGLRVVMGAVAAFGGALIPA
jgi:hypothetical protein